MRDDLEATNQALIRLGKLFPYSSDPRVYHCPADLSTSAGAARVRSYSMNGWMGSRYMENPHHSEGYRTFVRDSEIAASIPSRLWVILDEHQRSIDDAWFLVTMDDSQPFSSFPAMRHNFGYGLSFADGHVDAYHLRDPQSRQLAYEDAYISRKNLDWNQLKQSTTTR